MRKITILEKYSNCKKTISLLAAKCDLLREKIKNEKNQTAGYYLLCDLLYSEIAYEKQEKKRNNILMSFDSKKLLNDD